MNTADAERIFARIEASIAFAQQQNVRSIVLLGHGTGRIGRHAMWPKNNPRTCRNW